MGTWRPEDPFVGTKAVCAPPPFSPPPATQQLQMSATATQEAAAAAAAAPSDTTKQNHDRTTSRAHGCSIELVRRYARGTQQPSLHRQRSRVPHRAASCASPQPLVSCRAYCQHRISRSQHSAAAEAPSLPDLGCPCPLPHSATAARPRPGPSLASVTPVTHATLRSQVTNAAEHDQDEQPAQQAGQAGAHALL